GPVTLKVGAKANIFGAGRSVPPAPAGGGGGTLPPSLALPRGSVRVLKVMLVTGRITCCITGDKVFNGPAGRSGFPTDLSGLGPISGVRLKRVMFLAGVFLGAHKGPAPPTKTATTAPALGQVFVVRAGAAYQVPAGATRVYFGIADGYTFKGKPGLYGD